MFPTLRLCPSQLSSTESSHSQRHQRPIKCRCRGVLDPESRQSWPAGCNVSSTAFFPNKYVIDQVQLKHTAHEPFLKSAPPPCKFPTPSSFQFPAIVGGCNQRALLSLEPTIRAISSAEKATPTMSADWSEIKGVEEKGICLLRVQSVLMYLARSSLHQIDQHS